MEKLKPLLDKTMYQCPFYGFYTSHNAKALIDSQGNQCALITSSYSPCQMEMRNQTPSWNECPLNSKENKSCIEEIVASFRVFPHEFKPQDSSSWEGLSFGDWQEHVMNRSN